MKTFAEAFAARGMDDWDIAQAIKKLTRAHSGAPTGKKPFHGPNAADLRAWEKSGLTGAALTAAYVATYETANFLRHVPPIFAGTPAQEATAAIPPQAAPEPAAPVLPQARRPARARRAPAPRTKNPLDALLGAMHDAHLMQRESRRTRNTTAHA